MGKLVKCRILVDETLFSLAEQNDNLLDRKLFVKQGIAVPQASKTILAASHLHAKRI